MRDLLNSTRDFFYNVSLDIKVVISKHLDIGIGGSMNGVYILVPFTRLSMWIEWRDVSVGLGHEQSKGQWEFFAGRLQGVFCIEPSATQ